MSEPQNNDEAQVWDAAPESPGALSLLRRDINVNTKPLAAMSLAWGIVAVMNLALGIAVTIFWLASDPDVLEEDMGVARALAAFVAILPTILFGALSIIMTKDLLKRGYNGGVGIAGLTCSILSLTLAVLFAIMAPIAPKVLDSFAESSHETSSYAPSRHKTRSHELDADDWDRLYRMDPKGAANLREGMEVLRLLQGIR